MADITTPEDRTVRLALMDGLLHIGFFTGNALAGPIKKHLGLKYNFAFGLLFTVIAAAYTILFIKESLVKPKDKTKDTEEDCVFSEDGNITGCVI